ncbi:hypothetical protein [Mesorhizobium sp.]|uniref:hypothetical protein n=1 Tax=Mesorhizobium sp. TaxID=1871066 RepID=UPI003BACE0E4
MTLIQKLAMAYALLFFGLVAIGYVPAFNDANGNLFGLFSLQRYDDLLHAFTGIVINGSARSTQHSPNRPHVTVRRLHRVCCRR